MSDRIVPARSVPIHFVSVLRSILKATEINGDLTPRSARKVLFSEVATPHGQNEDAATYESPISKARGLDSSARRKSNKRLLERTDDDENDDVAFDDEEALANEILDGEEPDIEGAHIADEINVAPDTPTKAGGIRGRPRGRRKERSPTPPDNLPPHELFFFQNRAGSSRTSTNTFPPGALLNHEDYFAHIKAYADPHERDFEHLSRLHHFSFDQWIFELESKFSLCLYGYGSKRHLVSDFASYLHERLAIKPVVLMINGYNPSLTPKDILSTLSSALIPASARLPAPPNALLDAILAHLSSHPPKQPVYLLIHSIDAHPLRKHQAFLARLAAHASISLVATADTPTFPLLWPLPLLSQFRFVYHDTATFQPYDAEIDTVDEVNTLLGKSGRRVGGKDGVTFVLRSLPENARNLFRILVAEQLALMHSGVMSEEAVIQGGDDDDEDRLGFDDDMMDLDDIEPDTPSKTGRGRKPKKTKAIEKDAARKRREALVEGVEYRTLYHKAVEEFVCSSEMGFRTLLKEFYDHQIVESRKDGLGGERLVVPFGRAELDALLEELI
ncbi:ORC2-domain-containing protein [Myriangium duriaei CBS 260.36]|uniref:Origin recognition complex subunit 2 n=1 Tax=Myriangium duriaei CBS 260.36 TaxID=1168546 RepID=A0A9P4JCM9_9PEZI|nr:ORC2-domain-containing protein [Myriangium duriaei CBS 260.36]